MMNNNEREKRYQGTTVQQTKDRENRYQRKKRYSNTDYSMVDQSYIDSLLKDTNDYFNSASSDYGKMTWGTADSSYAARNAQWEGLQKRVDALGAYVYNNRNRMSKEQYDEYQKMLDSIYGGGRDIVGSYKSFADSMKNWSSQAEYDAWYQDEAERQKMASSQEATLGWDKYTNDQNTQSTPTWVNAVLRNNAATSDNPFVATWQNMVYDYSKDDSYKLPTNTWEEDEKKVFGYYYNVDPEQAYQYAMGLNNKKNIEAEQKQIEAIAQSATSNLGMGAVHSLTSLFAAMTGIADYANYLAMYAAGRPIMASDGGVSPFEYSQAAQGAITNKLNDMSGTFNFANMDIGLGNAYGLGMSIAQSMLSGHLLGGAGTLLNFFGQGAASGIVEAKQRGATDEQALLYGTALGAFEGVAEMLSFDTLISKTLSASTLKATLKNVLQQAGAEFMEEGATSVFDKLADLWILQDKGALQERANELVASGMSKEEAVKKVVMESLGQVLYDATTGALSGAISGGVETVVKNAQVNQVYKDTYLKDPDSLKALLEGIALENPNADISGLQSKFEQGKKISANELRKAVYANEQTLWNNDYNKIVDATEARLNELGETGNVRALAESIAKGQFGSFDDAILNAEQTMLNTGDANTLQYALADYKGDNTNITGKEQRAINKSNFGKSVQAELSHDIYSQEQYNDWAENAGTSRINRGAGNVVKAQATMKALRDATTSPTVTSNAFNYKSSAITPTLTKEGVQAKEKDLEGIANNRGYKGTTNEAFVKGYKGENLEEYQLGFDEAYRMGRTMVRKEELQNAVFKSYINEEAQMSAYSSGYTEAKYEAIKKAEGRVKTEKTKGGFTVTVPLYNEALTESRKTAIEFLKVMADIANANIKVVEDAKNHGLYDPKTNTIYIDINLVGKDFMVYSLSHELTHRIREMLPEEFDDFAKMLFEAVGEKMSVTERIKLWEKNNKQYYPKLTPAQLTDLAYEEVVCEMCESFLTDEVVARKLSEKVQKENRSLWERIKDFFTDLINRLTKAYEGLDPQSENGRLVREMTNDLTKVKEAWAELVVESGKVERKVIEQDLANKDVSHSRKYYEEHLSDLDKKYDSEEAMVSLETLKKRYEKVVEIWDRLGGELNSQFLEEWNNKSGKDRSFTVFKAQAGYKYNIELSSMCKKGVPLFEAIDTIVKKEVMKELNVKVIGKAEKQVLYDLLQKHNFDIPCQICYVEQARQREGGIIDAFLNGKVETNKKGETTKVKLGWNQILDMVEKEMKNLGVSYKFASVDRSIGSDSYTPIEVVMDEKTQKAYYEALKKVANDEITRYNKAERKARQLIKDTTPSAINATLGGTLPSNLKIIKTLFMESNSRLKIESDLLYSSMTTKNLATFHHELYTAFNMQGGVSGYKTKQGTVVYWGDILKKTWEQDTIRKAGGIRNQSNSDFQMYTFLDQVQMYIDFSAKGYYLQAYTKVLAELKLFGKSGAKINASLIPRVKVYQNADGSVDVERTKANAGLDENGNLIFDDIEGINHKEAFMLIADPEYSKSIGGICIGYSDNHIAKMLDDDRIQLIIGYHDKTDDPNARYRGARYAKNYNGLNEAQNGTKTVHIGFNKFVGQAEKKFGYYVATETFAKESITYKGETYVVDDIPRLAANLYLEECQRKGYAPAYSKCDIDFSKHPNYYKLLADFSLYNSEGHYCPHKKVQFNMPSTVPYLDANGVKSTMSSEAYIKKELEAEMKVRDSISEALADESADGLIPSFVREVNKLHTPENTLKFSKKDPRQITESDVRWIFDNIYEFDGGTYVPIRINTPHVLINAALNRGDKIDNLPIVMPVDKVWQAMDKEITFDTQHRAHGLSTDDMIAIIKAMDHPTYIVYQKNDRYVEIVRFETQNKKRAIAVLEIGDNKNAILMNGYKGGLYQILVTSFVPDNYQYIQDIINDKTNIVIYTEKKGASQRSSGSLVPSLLNESPFYEVRIPQNKENVNSKFSKIASDYDSLLESIALEDLLEWENMELYGGDTTIDDISEELNTTPEKVEIFFKREGLGDSYIEDGRKAVMTQARIDEAIEYNGASNPRYARRLITRISPEDFIDLTVLRENQNRDIFDSKVEGDSGSTMGTYDYKDALKSSRSNPYLVIDATTGRVIGHNGRHRMRAMELLGIKSVEIEVELYDDGIVKYHDGIIKDLAISSQFDTKTETHLSNIIPLNESYRADIEALYGENANPDAQVKYSRKIPDPYTSRELLTKALTKVAKGDEKVLLEQYKSNLRMIEGEVNNLKNLRKEIDAIKYKKSITYKGENLSVKEFEQRAYTQAEAMGVNAENVKFKAHKDTGKYVATVDGKVILEADKAFRSKEEADHINTLEHNYQATLVRISKYDASLLRIEAMQPMKQLLSREKAKAYKEAEAKGKEALKEYKAQALEEQKAITQRYQEMRHKNVEQRATTEMRHKLMNTVHTLDQLLVNPTKKKHIPIGLQKPVAEALNILNMDTVGAEERLAKITAELKVTDDPYEMEMLLERYNRIKAQGDKIKEKIDSLKSAYAEILNSEDDIIRNSYDEVIANTIEQVASKVGNTPVRDMTYDQLESLYKMYRMILKTIRDANKSFTMAKGEEITTLGQNVMSEVAYYERKDKTTIKMVERARGLEWNNLKPVYAFERIGSSTLSELYNNVRHGEDVWAVDMQEAKAYSDVQKAKYGFKSWDMDKTYTFHTPLGKEFKLNLGQIMSIYAYTRRGEQAIEHLINGGFVYDGVTVVEKKIGGKIKVDAELTDSTAYRLDEAVIGQINATLTKEQREFAEAMQKYLSETMGEKGNEVSLALYDIKIFGEKNYFPLKSSQVFLERAREQARGEVKIKNKGFTKETTPRANNPITLTSFMDVWADHCIEMSMYHAFTLPLEDFYRVYNYKERATDEKDTESVIMNLENAYGKSVTNYIDQLLVDLNGGLRTDPRAGALGGLIAGFKKASTMASLSVVVQQPSSIIRAMSMVDAKYFVDKPSKYTHKETWEEVKKYAPVAVIKEMGYFDVGLGKTSQEWLKNEPTKYEQFEEKWLTRAPALADEMGWNILWKAVKRETVAKHPELKFNSEEFLKECGRRFTEVVTLTQVYDSVFSRSANMRSKDTGMKMVTSFMAESTTISNMFEDAMLKARRGNKKVLGKTIGAIVFSSLVNAIAVSFVYAARDDDDEEYWSKYLKKFVDNFGSNLNPVAWIPIGRDIISVIEGYDIERADMSLISDFISAIRRLASNKVDAVDKVAGLIGAIANLFGIPLKNLYRDAKAIWNLFAK